MSRPKRSGSSWQPRWALAACLLALVPVAGVFTTTRIFHVRDLTMHFWPHHLWLRSTWAQGNWPWWDPYTAAGVSGIADSLNHVFMVPMTLFRLVASDVVGFNVWVALPLPLAALGAYLLFRIDVSRVASFLGSAAFALSGPMSSTPNFPNLSWTAALLPWVMWEARRTADQPSPGRIAGLGVVFGTQALCGEPVILGTSAAAAIALALVFAQKGRGRPLLAVVLGLGLGSLLASVQLVPLIEAGAHSARAEAGLDKGWPLHPLQLIETGVPHPFGHSFETFEVDGWMLALNDQASPFFYSLYVGLGLLLLAVASRAHPARRVRWFWAAVLIATLAAAFGDHTGLYPAVRALVPPLRTLRFPIKYFLLSTLALAALASLGWDALSGRVVVVRDKLHSVLALVRAIAFLAAFASIVFLCFQGQVEGILREVAALIDVRDAARSAAQLAARSGPLAVRTTLLAGGWAVLYWIATRCRRRAVALGALLVMTLADPGAINADLNPTLPRTMLGEPEWIQAMHAHGGGRVYVGGRWGRPGQELAKGAAVPSVDGAIAQDVPAEYSPMEAQSLAAHELSLSPPPWGASEIISYDMPALVSREYVTLLRQFVRHSQEQRMRFLSRSGVRYCVLPQPPSADAQPLARLKFFPMALYECNPGAVRAYVAAEAHVEPDTIRQIDALFTDRFDPARTVLLSEAAPGPAGDSGALAAETAGARIVSESPVEVRIIASAAPAGGYLVLLDSYTDSWSVTVDGNRARVLRAYAVFRAVRLGAGQHLVVFRYEPRALWAGIGLSTIGVAVVVSLLLPAIRRKYGKDGTLGVGGMLPPKLPHECTELCAADSRSSSC